MPDITRPDGAIIHYETFGAGPAVLLIAPGGVNSEIGMWARGPSTRSQSWRRSSR